MINYKVKVNNNVDELVNLFSQLGCKYFNHTCADKKYMLVEDGYASFCKLRSNFNECKSQELTIPKLKDLVVLKRNSIDDATHTDQDDWKWYVGADSYVWGAGNANQLQQWDKASLDLVELKPISPLKEYLVPQGNGKYALTKATEKRVSDWVEVAEGADTATFCEESGINYWKKNGLEWFSNSNKEWCIYSDMEEHIKNHGHKIVWTRHTQPEELLFVDDEQRRTYGLTKEKAERISKNTKDAYLAKYPINVDETKSLNDTYAEIEQVRQQSVELTLAERQSTYGDFTSVANTTGQLMAVILNSKNGQTLPYAHEEALHMICSKIARIMNGDINHKDSWHDIAGYATLIDESL